MLYVAQEQFNVLLCRSVPGNLSVLDSTTHMGQISEDGEDSKSGKLFQLFKNSVCPIWFRRQSLNLLQYLKKSQEMRLKYETW
jgi:hypothetical protein